MVDIEIVYEGDLHCRLTHGPSGDSIATDAPRDNQGRGEAFSPTDLVAAALGSCMATIMGIAARRENIDIEGTRVHVVKEMAADPKRRIGRISVRFDLPRPIDDSARAVLEEAARNCPVCQSLGKNVERCVEFTYPS